MNLAIHSRLTRRLAGGLLVILAVALIHSPGYTDWGVDVAFGPAFSGYNEVQVPGDTGTRFSLTEDLSSGPAFSVRGRLTWSPGERHHLSALAAPLRIAADGSLDRPLRFGSELFAAGTPLEARYRFDSYRGTYRYDFVRGQRWQFGAGLTGKVRSASITVRGDGREAQTSDLGFVPLVHVRGQWMAAAPIRVLVEADGLAAPQGRALDALVALVYDVDPRLGLTLGYRILEGGADVEQVYNFALVHYGVVGLKVAL